MLAEQAGFPSLEAGILAIAELGAELEDGRSYPGMIRRAVVQGRSRPEQMTKQDGVALVRALLKYKLPLRQRLYESEQAGQGSKVIQFPG